MANELNPVSGNSLDKSCGEPVGSNCVTWNGPAIPGISVCAGTSITAVVTQIGNSIGNLPAGLNFGCLWQPYIYTCPTGWTLVPGTATTAPYCTNGCPPGSINPLPNGSGGVICEACSPLAPCPPPAPVYGPNPIPQPTTLTAVLQLMINAMQSLCTCDPCLTISKTSSVGCPPGVNC